MKCPICNSRATVTDTRDGVDEIIRRRRCKKCKYIFYTRETDLDKKEGSRLLRYYTKLKYIDKSGV